MGIQISTPNYMERDDDLMFPPETLDKIVSFLTSRDLCIGREVCSAWMTYVADNGVLKNSMGIRVEKSEYILQNLARSPLPPTFSAFFLYNLELSRPTLPFWNLYSDSITHLEFNDCAVLPRNSLGQTNVAEFHLGCPNLKHLSLRNMDKYFMMGAQFLQLNEILYLHNLESLDVSNNKYLSDQILFAILEKTKRLASINLSSCPVLFVKAVHNRFYPKTIITVMPPFSDNILSFETLVNNFLRHSHVRELKLRSTSVNSNGIQLICDPDSFQWESIDLYDCRELKLQDYSDVITAQSGNLKKLILSATISKKLSGVPFLQNKFTQLNHLEIEGCREVKTLEFLQNMPTLKYFNIGSCDVEIHAKDFLHVKKLEGLNFSSLTLKSDMALCELCPQLIHVTDLNLADCGSWVTDNLIQLIIKNLSLLKRLNLQRTPVTDRGLAGTELDDFEEARFSSYTIETRRSALQERLRTIPDGICLSRLTDLRELNLSHCQDLGEATWKIALRLPSLSKLDLSYCPQISPKGILSIVNNCSSLEDLSLLNCGSHITAQPELIQTVNKSLYRLRRLVI